MNKIINFSIFMLVIIISSCNDQKIDIYHVSTKDTIHINPKYSQNKEIYFSQLLEKIEYTQLYSGNDFLIGAVDKLFVSDDYLFIIDRNISQSVYVLNKDGQKVIQINKRGNGPGEYIFLRDIAFNSENNELAILCSIKNRIMYYNLEGEFLRDETVPYIYERFYLLNNRQVLFCEYETNENLKKNNYYPNIILRDQEKDSVISCANYFEGPVNKSFVWTSYPQFSHWRDTLSIKPDHSDVVYHITKEGIYPAYKLDSGPYNIDEKYWKKTKEMNMDLEKISKYSDELDLCDCMWYLEGSKYIYFSCHQNKIIYKFLYSKLTKNMISWEQIVNDLDYITLFNPIAIHNDQLYCLISSEEIFLLKNDLKGFLPDKILNNIEEFGNPVLAVFTLKDF